jgi:hypothetical protein
MALEILASFIPTSVGGAIGLLVQILIIWVVVMLADKIIAHQIQAKHSLILAVLAYFLSPLVLAFAAISIPFAGIIVPLIVWIVLGEVLLRGYSGGAVARLKVAAIAFVIYLILNMVGVPGMIAAAIGI